MRTSYTDHNRYLRLFCCFPTFCRLKETSRALWKFSELSQHNNGGVGSLRARFQLTNGPGSQGTIAAQFNCEGTTLSGVDFQLIGPGYRLSLAKKRFVSGKLQFALSQYLDIWVIDF